MHYRSAASVELIRACAEGGGAAPWEEFVRRFHRLIAGVAMRTARRWGETSLQLVDDLVQETYLKLCSDGCRLLREFQPTHPDAIFGYLKVVTANVVHDYFRALHSTKRRTPPGYATPEQEPAVEDKRLGSARQIERSVLLKELDDCLRQANPGPTQERDRRIFWLYYRQGLTARAIASLPSIGLGTKGVESTILRVTHLVRQRMAEAPLRRDEKGTAREKSSAAENRYQRGEAR